MSGRIQDVSFSFSVNHNGERRGNIDIDATGLSFTANGDKKPYSVTLHELCELLEEHVDKE